MTDHVETNAIFLKPKGKTLMIGVAGYKTAPWKFVEQMANHGIRPELTVDGVALPMAHNRMVDRALQQKGWDYLVFLEIDHNFPPGFLDRMRTYTEPVVAGAYFRRHPPNFLPTWGFFQPDGINIRIQEDAIVLDWLDHPKKYPVEVVPMGCTAIRRDVLEQWPEKEMPWFNHPVLVNNLKDGKRHVWEISDDVWFCRSLKKQGIAAFVDTGLVCGHYAEIEINADTFRMLAARRAKEPVKVA